MYLKRLNLIFIQHGCLTRYVNDNLDGIFNGCWGNWFVSHCPDIYTLVHGKQKMTITNETKSMWKMWGVAFMAGATLGLLVEQAIMFNSIKKDCEILGAFRIGETPYHCKPSTK